jgi:hypothetical protein
MGPEVALIGTLVSGVVGFVGQMQQASAQQDAAKYQAAVARNNQIVAQQNAGYAAQAGAVEAQARDRRNAAVAGSILAGQGASGIDVASNAGTAGTIGGFSSLLGGANSFADKWMKYQNVGITPFSGANNLGDWSPRGAV